MNLNCNDLSQCFVISLMFSSFVDADIYIKKKFLAKIFSFIE